MVLFSYNVIIIQFRMNKHKDLFKFIIFISIFLFLVLTILAFKDWFSEHMFGIDKNISFKGSGRIHRNNNNMLYAYTTEKQKINHDYAIKFKNILTSSANKDKHFLVDLTFLVNNEKDADLFERYKENITAIIKDILSKYTFNHIKSDKGKSYLKKQITESVEKKIGSGIIKDLYIETIIYN